MATRPREFTVDDFMAQMGQITKLGPMNKVMRAIPGMSQLTTMIGDQEIEAQMKRMRAIYDSMSKGERKNMGLMNGMRRHRIARGAGVRAVEVIQFVRQYEMSRDMMKAVGGMGFRRR